MTSTPPPSESTRPGRGETRDRLVRAALDLFTSLGYHESTTPRIADRAGVAEGTIYRHFQSKEQLLNEIFRAGVRLFRRAAGTLPARGDTATQLATLARAWCATATREPHVAQLVFGADLHRYLDHSSRAAIDGLNQVVVSIIAAGKAHGTVREGPATTWALIWMRLVTLAIEQVARGAWRPDDVAVERVLDGAWNAVRYREPAEGGQPLGNR